MAFSFCRSFYNSYNRTERLLTYILEVFVMRFSLTNLILEKAEDRMNEGKFFSAGAIAGLVDYFTIWGVICWTGLVVNGIYTTITGKKKD